VRPELNDAELAALRLHYEIIRSSAKRPPPAGVHQISTARAVQAHVTSSPTRFVGNRSHVQRGTQSRSLPEQSCRADA
jgi:hypothetical protein